MNFCFFLCSKYNIYKKKYFIYFLPISSVNPPRHTQRNIKLHNHRVNKKIKNEINMKPVFRTLFAFWGCKRTAYKIFDSIKSDRGVVKPLTLNPNTLVVLVALYDTTGTVYFTALSSRFLAPPFSDPPPAPIFPPPASFPARFSGFPSPSRL